LHDGKIDEKTGRLTDPTTGDFIARQLEAFASFIERLQGTG